MSPQIQQITCILLLLCLIRLFKHWYDNKKYNPKYGYIVLWLAAVSFSMFYNSGYDYYGYERIYEEYAYTHLEYHMESFYFRVIDFLPQSYLLWRFSIWGSAGLIWFFTCHEMKCSSTIAGLFFMTIPLFQYFYYLREALAMGLLVLSLCLLQRNDKKFRIMIIAIALLITSFFLHKSVVVYLSIFLMSWFIPLNKITITITILLVPLLRFFVGKIANTFLELGFLEDSLTRHYGKMYLEEESSIAYNAAGYLRLFITFFPIIYAVLLYVFRKINNKLEKAYSKLIDFSYYIMYLFVLFWDNMGQTQMAIRFMVTSCVPIFFYMTFHTSHRGIIGKHEHIILYSSVIYICFTLFLTVFFYK